MLPSGRIKPVLPGPAGLYGASTHPPYLDRAMNSLPPHTPRQGLPAEPIRREPYEVPSSDHDDPFNLGLVVLALLCAGYWFFFTGTPTVASKVQQATLAYLQSTIDGQACSQAPAAAK